MARADPEGAGVQTSSGKSQVTIGFLRNTGMDPLDKQLVSMAPNASRGRFVRPSIEYVDD